ncbi:hypothetical protein ACFLZN_00645, partial [Nanoarchaeota archaeon]
MGDFLNYVDVAEALGYDTTEAIDDPFEQGTHTPGKYIAGKFPNATKTDREVLRRMIVESIDLLSSELRALRFNESLAQLLKTIGYSFAWEGPREYEDCICTTKRSHGHIRFI